MGQPTPYDPSYSFTDFSSGSPSSQPPGVKLDAEFEHIAETLHDVLTNLAKLQRDDQALANRSVGVDQLAASALAIIASSGWKNRGEWITGRSYQASDFFASAGSIYLSIVDHVSSSIVQNVADGMIVAIFDEATNGLANRAVLVPDGEAQITIPVIADRATKFAAFDDQGRIIARPGTNANIVDAMGTSTAVAPSQRAVSDAIAAVGSVSPVLEALEVVQDGLDALQAELPAFEPRQPLAPYSATAARMKAAAAALDFHFYDPQLKAARPVYGGGYQQLGLAITYMDPNGVPALWVRHSLTNLWFNRWRETGDDLYRQRVLDDYERSRSVLYPQPGLFTGGSGYYNGDTSHPQITIVTSFDDGCWLAEYHRQAALCGHPDAPKYLVDTITEVLKKFLPAADASNPVTQIADHAPNLTNIDYSLGTYVDGQTGVSRYYGPPVVISKFGSRYVLPGADSYIGTYGESSSSFECHLALAALTAYDLLGYSFMLDYAKSAQAFVRDFCRTPDPAATPNDPAHTPATPGERKARYLVECNFRLNTTVASNDPYPVVLRPDKQWYGNPKRNADSTSIGGAFSFCVLSARLYRLTAQDSYRQDAVDTATAIMSLQGYGRINNGKTIIAETRDPHSDGHLAYPFVTEVLTLPGIAQELRDTFVAAGEYIGANCLTETGYVTADWAGPETDGTYTTWEAQYAVNGVYAGAVQIMTSAESISMLHACSVQASRASLPASGTVLASSNAAAVALAIDDIGLLDTLELNIPPLVLGDATPASDTDRQINIRWTKNAKVVTGDVVWTWIKTTLGRSDAGMSAIMQAAKEYY